jgi:hypothetical protein
MAGLAFPPYVAVQWQSGPKSWGLFRLGWRYDVNWGGYIFPTAALKSGLSQPMGKGY